MGSDDLRLPDLIRRRVLRLNAQANGITTGLLCGIGLFIATNWLVIKGGDNVGPHLQLLANFFFGYRVTFAGSLIGFAYAFVFGFGAAWLSSRVYNRIIDLRYGDRSNDDGAR